MRERAIRMVLEHRGEYPSLWATIESIAPKIGCVPQTLNDWVRQHEVDAGVRDGISSDERARIKDSSNWPATTFFKCQLGRWRGHGWRACAICLTKRSCSLCAAARKPLYRCPW